MGYALLFSGQGTQHGDMLPWLASASAAQPLLASLQASLGRDWRQALADSACRSSNAVAQPLVTGTALAAWAVLAARLKTRPMVVAGYSVGELAAFSAAGALDPGDALRLARLRASAMDAAIAGVDTGLLAISAVNEAEVLAACPDLECAIRIDPDNNVFGGARDALAHARQTLGHRAQFKPICVALASHTSWMRSASEAFARDLQGMVLQIPACPIATNATGATTRNAAELTGALALQIRQTVQWGACMAAVAERQPSCVLEIGGGRALAGMWSARYPRIPARSLDEFRGPNGAAAWIERQA